MWGLFICDIFGASCLEREGGRVDGSNSRGDFIKGTGGLYWIWTPPAPLPALPRKHHFSFQSIICFIYRNCLLLFANFVPAQNRHIPSQCFSHFHLNWFGPIYHIYHKKNEFGLIYHIYHKILVSAHFIPAWCEMLDMTHISVKSHFWNIICEKIISGYLVFH